MSYSPQSDTEILHKVEVPKKYKVILLNDDFTPMDFVLFVLESFFQKSPEEAQHIMMNVHTQGSGVAGVYTFEIAEMKVHQVNQLSQKNQYPLKTIMEAE